MRTIYFYFMIVVVTLLTLQCSSTNKKIDRDYTYLKSEKRSTIYDTLVMIQNDMDKYDIDLVGLRTEKGIGYSVKDIFRKLRYRSLDNKLDKESISLTIDILKDSYDRIIKAKRKIINVYDIGAFEILYTLREPDALDLILDISSNSIDIKTVNGDIVIVTNWQDLGDLGRDMLINYFSTFDNKPIQEYLDTISAENMAFEERENKSGGLFHIKLFKQCFLKDMQKKISKGNYTFSNVSEKKYRRYNGFGIPNALFPVYIKNPSEFDPAYIEIYKQIKEQLKRN